MKNGENYAIPEVAWDNVQATGVIISSVHDMSTWMILNMNHGINGPDTLLTKVSRNKIWNVENPFPVNQTARNSTGTQ